MTIETILHETLTKGIGLFTKQEIKKGDVVYIDDKNFDKIIPKMEYDRYTIIQKKYIDEYASYISSIDSFYLCCDNARFFNHSESPNTKYINNKCIAVRDIKIGEELTGDYREFCDICKNGDFGFEILN